MKTAYKMKVKDLANKVKAGLALLVTLAAERARDHLLIQHDIFQHQKVKFIIADTPGHAQYTRNMATGASTSSLSILLIDVEKAYKNKTRRHSFISTLLGIRHLIVAINKMDLMDYQQAILIRSSKITFILLSSFQRIHYSICPHFRS